MGVLGGERDAGLWSGERIAQTGKPKAEVIAGVGGANSSCHRTSTECPLCRVGQPQPVRGDLQVWASISRISLALRARPRTRTRRFQKPRFSGQPLSILGATGPFWAQAARGRRRGKFCFAVKLSIGFGLISLLKGCHIAVGRSFAGSIDSAWTSNRVSPLLQGTACYKLTPKSPSPNRGFPLVQPA